MGVNVLHFNVTEKPGKPQNLEMITATDSSITLAWQPPASDGGSEIFNYVIEYRAEGEFKWKQANHEHVAQTSYVIKRLKEGAMYEFRVAAENKAGVGPYSDPTQPMKCKAPVGKFLRKLHFHTKVWFIFQIQVWFKLNFRDTNKVMVIYLAAYTTLSND